MIDGSHEYCMALRHGRLYAERLIPSPQPRLRPTSRSPQPSTTIISGGVKGLGLEYARQALHFGCKCLVATSRRPQLSKEELISLVQDHPASAVFLVAADSGSAAAMQRVTSWAHENLPVVENYVHAAGLIGMDNIADVSEERLWEVARPKVTGVHAPSNAQLPTVSLHGLSSTSAVWSQSQAAHYSMANAYLDAFADFQR